MSTDLKAAFRTSAGTNREHFLTDAGKAVSLSELANEMDAGSVLGTTALKALERARASAGKFTTDAEVVAGFIGMKEEDRKELAHTVHFKRVFESMARTAPDRSFKFISFRQFTQGEDMKPHLSLTDLVPEVTNETALGRLVTETLRSVAADRGQPVDAAVQNFTKYKEFDLPGSFDKPKKKEVEASSPVAAAPARRVAR
jgi:hypothetical protein